MIKSKHSIDWVYHGPSEEVILLKNIFYTKCSETHIKKLNFLCFVFISPLYMSLDPSSTPSTQ